jgi:hypothetical protein
MKKTLLAIGFALVTLAALAALAADTSKGIITINGGNQAVKIDGRSGKITPGRAPKKPLYSNFNTDTSNLYNCCSGWTISDGTTLGEEFTAANSFKSPRTTTTSSITAGLSLAGGVGENYVQLVKDCKGMPCHVDYKKSQTMCRSLATFTQSFGSCCAVVKAKCVAKVQKGKTYWIVMESKSTDNTFTVWNWSNATNANGPDMFSLNDAPWSNNGSGNPQGAFAIQ